MGWGVARTADGYTFRVWAPEVAEVGLAIRGRTLGMSRDDAGWWSGTAEAGVGDAYGFDVGGTVLPDPAARAMRGGLGGSSVIVDPDAYRWRHGDWRGRPWAEAVISEIHVGTFTPEGTFRAAIPRLGDLARSGITAVELMPVAQFAGARGWGYDGVLLFAPHDAYGSPDDLKALVDAAHGAGLMAFLDVVYNHFGPEGNPLGWMAPAFFRPGRETPWGAAIAYEEPAVRAFFIENALYWLDEFRFDGLRFDAADHVQDEGSDEEILVEIARVIRQRFPDRRVHLATEDNRNVVGLHPWEDGRPLIHTAEWNDDLHNVAHVIATGETEGYYIDFAERRWAKLARALAEGFAYQGEPSRLEGGRPRGVPSAGQPPLAFVDFIQNHDQVGNRAFGERLGALAPAETVRALTALLLLSPHVPLLFMGQEWGEKRPFVFFCDFEGPLADAVRDGRRAEFAGFAAFRDPAVREEIPDPNDAASFAASKLDWTERERADGRAWLDLTAGLLAVRHREIVPLLAGARHGGRVVAADDGVVAVDWPLGGAVLRMRANLTDAARRVPPAAGRAIRGGGGDMLAAFGVLVTVAPA